VLICGIVLLFVNPKPADNLPEGFRTPIIAFEFIQTPEEVNRFFDVPDAAQYIQSMLTGNLIDYAFMLLYSILVFCIAWYINKKTASRTLLLAMFFAVIMLASDAMENYQIYLIISNFKTGDISAFLKWLNIFTWLKWSAIVSSFLLFAPYFFEGKLLHKLISASCVMAFALCIAAFLKRGILNEIMANSVVLVFVMLIVFVFTTKPVLSKVQ
jgi:hypothetical protein